MTTTTRFDHRRALLKSGLAALGAQGLGVPLLFNNAAHAAASQDNRILVVLEMSGGNDGLNTVVPYADDAYYRLRPTIGLKPAKLRKIDDHFGFSPGMAGFETLYKNGQMAIVHGCGYDNPSFSHFTSMAYWHTAAPNSGQEHGWVGRLADQLKPAGARNYLVNIDSTQSLAVRSVRHTPVVFDDPVKFQRASFYQERDYIDRVADPAQAGSDSLRYLRNVATSAKDASALVREAWARYKTPVDYGIIPVDLTKVAALIDAGLPTRLFYVAYRNNAFDTHVHQGDLHQRLLTYVSDAVYGFMRDMERIGRADDVVLLAFSEFGRRVAENTSLGTDHGTAGPMFIFGKPVKGGHHGQPVSLTQLHPDGNLIHTADFRRTYATLIEGWLGAESKTLLGGDFAPFPVFG
ncbi:MAG: DUF1501 domain-containing protein [Betaproteobacteria bacterium]|nr:DUF1501 domain-containing protein [Betaproteobacteria bacterium]